MNNIFNTCLPHFPILLLVINVIPCCMLTGIAIGHITNAELKESTTYRWMLFWIWSYTTTIFLLALYFTYNFYLNTSDNIFYQIDFQKFHIRFFADIFSIVFLLLTSIITNIAFAISHRYLHREEAYNRFFFGLGILLLGFSLILTSSSLDILFAGWEFIGLSSFIMIGFYRFRPQAAFHATRAFLTFRFCDVGLLIGAILSHHLGPDIEHHLFESNTILNSNFPMNVAFVLSILLLIAAMGKSAQFPFSSWLPRAFEGPSHSSAVFYGAISIHAGIFLLLRTRSLWESHHVFCSALFCIGLFSAGHAFLVGSYQSNLKSQIAWRSIANLGIMFCELATHQYFVCLGHVVLNASLRSFQFLTASSAVIVETRAKQKLPRFPKKSFFSIPSKFQLACANEFYFDRFIDFYLLRPLRLLSTTISRCFQINPNHQHNFALIQLKFFQLLALEVSLVVISFLTVNYSVAIDRLLKHQYLTAKVLFIFGILISLVSFLVRKRPQFFFISSLGMCHVFATAILATHTSILLRPYLMFCFGIHLGFQLILLSLKIMSMRKTVFEDGNTLFYGLAESFPGFSMVLCLGFLFSISFPITSSFWGEDMIIEYGIEHFFIPTLIAATLLFLNQLISIVVFSKLYFGPAGRENQPAITDIGLSKSVSIVSALLIAGLLSIWMSLQY